MNELHTLFQHLLAHVCSSGGIVLLLVLAVAGLLVLLRRIFGRGFLSAKNVGDGRRPSGVAVAFYPIVINQANFPLSVLPRWSACPAGLVLRQAEWISRHLKPAGDSPQAVLLRGRYMVMMRMGVRMRLIGLILLLPACALANDRIISVLPSVASMVPSESAACKRESKALLKHDAEVADWRHTQWDVEIVASAGTFIAIGIPQERALLEEVRRINPSLKVVDAGVGVQKIADNPYFFVSMENREKIMKNLRSAYSCDDLVVCGNPLQPRTSIYSSFGFKSKSYTVAIAHPAFAYECLDCGVGTVMLDVGRLNKDAHYRKEQLDSLIRRRANIVLKLPGSRGPSSEFLAESRLREVEFDVFDTRLWLPGVLYENLRRRDEELEYKEELSRMYAATLLKGIRFESFDIRDGESLAQLLNRIQAVLDSAVDINLPIEKRKLNLDFSGAPGAASRCLAPASLANMSGLDVLRYACRTIGCDFTFSTPWIADEESLRTLYIISLEAKADRAGSDMIATVDLVWNKISACADIPQ